MWKIAVLLVAAAGGAGLFAVATRTAVGWVAAAIASIGSVWVGAAALVASPTFSRPGTATEPPQITAAGWGLVAVVTLVSAGLLVAALWLGSSRDRKEFADRLGAARHEAVPIAAGTPIERRVFTGEPTVMSALRGTATHATVRCADGWVHVYTESGDVLFAGGLDDVSCVLYHSLAVIKGPAGQVKVAAHPAALHSTGATSQAAREATESMYVWLSLAVDGLHQPEVTDPQVW